MSTRFIWAIDPNLDARTQKLQLATFKALDKLTGNRTVEIEPVAVLRPDQLKVPARAFQTIAKKYELEFETTLKKMLKPLKSKKLIAPRLLVEDSRSMHVALDVLLRYAKSSGARLIAVGTHSRKGMERAIVGSFAETLLLNADVPVLIVNPKSPPTKKISKIFFPTDLSDSSSRAFTAVLDYAKFLNASVILYHKVEYVLPTTTDVLTYLPTYQNYFKEDLVDLNEKGRFWKEIASKQGVKASFHLDDKPAYVGESILKAAKKAKTDMIAMAANSGAFATALLGSVTRDVTRTAKMPVLIIREDK